MMGHRPSSNMFDVYSHGKFKDIDNALKKIYGKGQRKDRKRIDSALSSMKDKNPQLLNAVLDFIEQEIKVG